MLTPDRRREWLLVGPILACALGTRLIAISQPYVDAWSWRQADVAMIAENFYRLGFALFYPQINWAGTAPGYVGTEFPLVPFLAALLYGAFGVRAWIGRPVSVAFFRSPCPFSISWCTRPRMPTRRFGRWPSIVPSSLYECVSMVCSELYGAG